MNFQVLFIGICLNIVTAQVTIPLKDHCSLVASSNPKCQQIKCGTGLTKQITRDLADVVVRTFNQIRQKVAEGKVNGLPKAANMNALSYDEDLAKTAAGDGKCPQSFYKNHCNASDFSMYADDEVLCPGRFSFTVLFASNNEKEACSCSISQDSLKHFIQFFGKDTNLLLSYQTFSKITESHPNYIQIMWAKSKRIGCSLSCSPQHDQSLTEVLLRCLVSPCGNIPGEIPYEEGETCSKCDSTCSEDFPGLCK